MSDFKIEKGIPVPPTKNNAENIPRNSPKYPWDQMVPGDSFLVAIPSTSNARATRNRVQGAGIRWCKRHRPDMAIEARIESKTHVRIWMSLRKDVFVIPEDPIE